MAEYTEFSAQACQREFAERSCKANQPAIFYDRTPVQKKCNKIIYGRDRAALEMRAAFGDSVEAMNANRWRSFHKEHQDRYAELVQTNPILVMVSGPRPRIGEVVKALHTIQGNALTRYETVQRDLARGHDLEKYAGRYHVLGYSESLWNGSGKSEAEFARWRAHFVQKYTERESREALLEVGALVGITWGRTLAPAMAMMKVGCLAGLGIPLNAFFLIDSIRGYDRDFRNFFSSVEFAQPFFEKGLDRLDGDRADLVLNALFLPLGVTQLAPRAMSRAYRQALGRP